MLLDLQRLNGASAKRIDVDRLDQAVRGTVSKRLSGPVKRRLFREGKDSQKRIHVPGAPDELEPSEPVKLHVGNQQVEMLLLQSCQTGLATLRDDVTPKSRVIERVRRKGGVIGVVINDENHPLAALIDNFGTLPISGERRAFRAVLHRDLHGVHSWVVTLRRFRGQIWAPQGTET